MNTLTFSEIFCAQNQIPPEQFARVVFNRVLYRRARLVSWLLPLLKGNYFAADFDLIYGVERLRWMREFTSEAERFNEHPANRGWLRRTLYLRISTKRLRALIRDTLPRTEENGSRSGLPVKEEPTGPVK